MTANDVRIRPAIADDLATITEIYGHHVLNGLASFEEMPPDLAEMRARFDRLMDEDKPYLVAETDQGVVGYAYAGAYRARHCYRFTLEDAIYMAPGLGGRGVGLQLLNQLIADCTAGGWRQLIAVIGDSANTSSIRVHEKAGFRLVGVRKDVGFKKGRWVDTVQMQRPLGPGGSQPPNS